MAEEVVKQEELTPEEKLLEVIQKGEASGAGTAPDASVTLGDETDGKPVSRPMGDGGGAFQITTLNKLLVLVVVVFLGFAGSPKA